MLNFLRALYTFASTTSLFIVVFSILADDAPSIFSIYFFLISIDQFITYLTALVWGSDRGGPVEEAEKAKVASVWRT